MDDLNDHICSILTHRRLLSVDEWMDIFSDMQRKTLYTIFMRLKIATY